MALKEALQRGSIQSSPYQKQGNVKNSDQLHMFSENQKSLFRGKTVIGYCTILFIASGAQPYLYHMCAGN